MGEVKENLLKQAKNTPPHKFVLQLTNTNDVLSTSSLEELLNFISAIFLEKNTTIQNALIKISFSKNIEIQNKNIKNEKGKAKNVNEKKNSLKTKKKN